MSVSITETVYTPFPNKYERALILVLFEKKIITFNDQTIFKNNLSFKRAMKHLHSFNIVAWRCEKKYNEYKLTNFGEHIGLILNEFKK